MLRLSLFAGTFCCCLSLVPSFAAPSCCGLLLYLCMLFWNDASFHCPPTAPRPASAYIYTHAVSSPTLTGVCDEAHVCISAAQQQQQQRRLLQPRRGPNHSHHAGACFFLSASRCCDARRYHHLGRAAIRVSKGTSHSSHMMAASDVASLQSFVTRVFLVHVQRLCHGADRRTKSRAADEIHPGRRLHARQHPHPRACLPARA